MLKVKEIADNYKFSPVVSNEDAAIFIDMVERGMSIDAVIEMMSSARSECSAGGLARRYHMKRLARNKLIRQSPLFCALLGVNVLIL